VTTDIEKASAELQQLVAEVDTGGRKPAGATGRVIFGVALAWALFQLWYASPLPFTFAYGVLNDTEARALHLGFALFLAFLAWPATKRSPRDRVPWQDWVFAAAGAFAAAYMMLFYAQLSTRPGQPTPVDLAVAITGLVLLLEATRRSVGWPMAALATIFIGYCLLGPWLPELISHKGASFSRLMSHMWLTTEGVFGIALGVSTGTIFVYVLFGSMLDRASFHATVAGIFTIPLMKKAGYGGVKAGAIETMSSVDGQIMPPVMGAAAFLMVEYVGIPYAEIVKHAFLPAILSYMGLFYIVHLEALKLGMRPIIRREPRPMKERLIRFGLGISGTIIVCALIYWLLEGMKRLLGDAAPWAIIAMVGALYVFSVKQAAACPDLPQDIDIDNPRPLETWPAVRAGLHFMLPVGVLIWCLMVEEMSPSLSAFWSIVMLVVLMLTQRPLLDFFRGARTPDAWTSGWHDVVQGLNDGARNMIGIGVATATAGVIVGAITLTGLALRMTEFVEFVSHGNVIIMLLFIAAACLVLGLGVPTTANYVLVATLMAPVVVELGAQAGLIIPLIAVHLFVFYYGIMGDITPPVGLATFAAVAISGEDMIETGIQGSLYALRTVILPFIWIFNPQLLLIDVHGTAELVRVVVASTVAMLVFAAVTMNWFRVKSRLWESALLLAAVALLFRPDFFMDFAADEYVNVPAKQIFDVARDIPSNDRLVMVIKGSTIEGDEVTKTVAIDLGEAGADGRKRLADAGVTVAATGDRVQITGVKFGSRARKSRVEQGWEIQRLEVPSGRPSAHWFYVPAFVLIGLVWWVQGRRMKPAAVPALA